MSGGGGGSVGRSASPDLEGEGDEGDEGDGGDGGGDGGDDGGDGAETEAHDEDDDDDEGGEEEDEEEEEEVERRAEMAGDADGSAANPVELGGDDGDDEGHATGRGGEGEEEGIAAPCKEPRAPRPQGQRRQGVAGVAGSGKKPRPLPMRASAAAAARALSGVTYHVAAIGEASEAELLQALPSYHPYPWRGQGGGVRRRYLLITLSTPGERAAREYVT